MTLCMRTEFTVDKSPMHIYTHTSSIDIIQSLVFSQGNEHNMRRACSVYIQDHDELHLPNIGDAEGFPLQYKLMLKANDTAVATTSRMSVSSQATN